MHLGLYISGKHVYAMCAAWVTLSCWSCASSGVVWWAEVRGLCNCDAHVAICSQTCKFPNGIEV